MKTTLVRHTPTKFKGRSYGFNFKETWYNINVYPSFAEIEGIFSYIFQPRPNYIPEINFSIVNIHTYTVSRKSIG